MAGTMALLTADHSVASWDDQWADSTAEHWAAPMAHYWAEMTADPRAAPKADLTACQSVEW